MTILGNICLGLAAFMYLLPLQTITHGTHFKNDGGALWSAAFILAPLWFFLTVALCAVTARGGLDWLLRSRQSLYLLVIVAGVAMFFATGFSFLGKFEHPSQMPLSTRYFAGWAVQVFPLIIIFFSFLALNPKLGAAVPALLFRIPAVTVAGLCMLLCLGLVFEALLLMNKAQSARIQEVAESDNKRDRDILDRLNTLNANEHFAELLGHTNRFEEPAIRELALSKISEHPNITEALIIALTQNASSNALVYLDVCEPLDKQALAEPVRAAIIRLAGLARDNIARTHSPYAEQFDWDTRLILSVAEKFQDQGVNYLPAIREYRAALEEPHPNQIEFTANKRIDSWLASQTKSKKAK